LISWTSPRTTKLLHQRRDLLRLANVFGVPCEAFRLGGEPGSPAVSGRSLCDRLTRGLRAAYAAAARDLVERRKAIVSESERERG